MDRKLGFRAMMMPNNIIPMGTRDRVYGKSFIPLSRPEQTSTKTFEPSEWGNENLFRKGGGILPIIISAQSIPKINVESLVFFLVKLGTYPRGRRVNPPVPLHYLQTQTLLH